MIGTGNYVGFLFILGLKLASVSPLEGSPVSLIPATQFWEKSHLLQTEIMCFMLLSSQIKLP